LGVPKCVTKTKPVCLSIAVFFNNLSVCLSAVRAYSSTTDEDAWVCVVIDKSSQSINWQKAINAAAQCLAKSCGYIDPCVGHSSINLIRIINTDVVALMLLLLMMMMSW